MVHVHVHVKIWLYFYLCVDCLSHWVICSFMNLFEYTYGQGMCDVVKLFGGSCWMESVLRFFLRCQMDKMICECLAKVR